MLGGPNNRSHFFGQSTSQQHTFLNNRNKFNSFTMPPQCNQFRQFQSSSSHWSGKGNRLNGKPTTPHSQNYHQTAPIPHHQYNIISGVCDYILPHNNFSSKFSQKPKDMRDYPVILPTLPLKITQPQPNIHTIMTVASPIMEAAVDAVMTTIFSAEDFPALSKPKPIPSVKELWEQELKKKTDDSYRKAARQTNKYVRQRQLSECSDDSFIVFFTESVVDNNDDDDVDFDDESDKVECSDTEGYEFVCKKKVHFDPNPPTIHTMGGEWSDALQEARKGEWEQYARDRDRFSNRIKMSAEILNPILSKTHRDNIYNERYTTNYD